MSDLESKKSGPFGLCMGMTLEELNLQPNEGNDFDYYSEVPRPHPEFDPEYSLRIVPGFGLISIYNSTPPQTSDVFGHALRAKFQNLLRRFERVYGPAYLTDKLLEGSIWDEPRDFMQGLQCGDRRLSALWDLDDDCLLPNDISSIYLSASVDKENSEVYRISVSYDFINNEEAEKEIERMVDDVL